MCYLSEPLSIAVRVLPYHTYQQPLSLIRLSKSLCLYCLTLVFLVSNSNKYFVVYKSEGYLCNLTNFDTQEEADKCAKDFGGSVVYTDFNTLFFKVLGPLAP